MASNRSKTNSAGNNPASRSRAFPLSATRAKKLMRDLHAVLSEHGMEGKIHELALRPKASVFAAAGAPEGMPRCPPGQAPVAVFRNIGGQTVMVFECR